MAEIASLGLARQEADMIVSTSSPYLTAATALQSSGALQQYSRHIESTYPGLRLAHDVTFEEIWTLLLASGFLYPEKIARLQPVLPEIEQTVRRLLAANGHLMATAVMRGQKALEAHIGTVRWYEQTWLVQHLAALPMSARRACASQVTLGFTQYGQRRPDFVWGKIYYRPDNLWPARVFGGYSRRVTDPATSDSRTFHYLVAPTTGAAAPWPTGIEVRAGDEADRVVIEDWFTARGRTVEVQANQLQAGCRGVAAISRDYEAAGLMRRRESLVAHRHGHVTGFALLEMASLGVNFSELTNAFTVHLVDDGDEDSRRALVAAAKERYAALGRLQCVALAEGDTLSAFAAAGFSKTREYTCWTFHREHLFRMEESFRARFGVRTKDAA